MTSALSQGHQDILGAGLDLDITTWDPAQLLSSSSNDEDGYAVVILNQPLEDINLLELIWKKAGYRVAADGGTNRLLEASSNSNFAQLSQHVPLEVVCGDLDSLTPTAREWAESLGAVVAEDLDQYSTDFTKSVKYIRKHYTLAKSQPPTIVCMGGLGGRVDQAMSILHHLYMFQNEPGYPSGRVYLITSEAISFVLQAGKHRIRARDSALPVLDKHVGIVPLREPSHITTRGFEWDVDNWYTAFGDQMSTSNHVKDDILEISTTKDVLFTIDLKIVSKR